MFRPIKVISVELSQPLVDIEGIHEYSLLTALVCWYGRPLGYVNLPVVNGRCAAHNLRQAILEKHAGSLIYAHLEAALQALPHSGPPSLDTLFDQIPPVAAGPWPLVTVAVCTRDRTDNLALCLDSLNQLDYDNLDILVVDNAPSDDAAEKLVKIHYPHVRYVCEARPGLNWARNRAIDEALGEILAFTDDDVIVDTGWVKAVAQLFMADEDVSAVTGLVAPYELETEAQQLFERYGGFGRGFSRQWYRTDPRINGDSTRQHGGTGKFGTGANMAYRRSVFEQIGYFDVALDVGTATNGGGDLDMFFRVLKEGHTLVYEPAAIVWHRHRRDYDRLRTQLANNGIGFYAYLVRNWLAYPTERWAIFALGLWWFFFWSIHRMIGYTLRPFLFPRDLVWAELKGSLVGLTRYQKARRQAATMAGYEAMRQCTLPQPATLSNSERKTDATAVRMLDFSQGITDLKDVIDYPQVTLYICWQEQLLGQVDIANYYHPISAAQIRQAAVDWLNINLLVANNGQLAHLTWGQLSAALNQQYGLVPEEAPPQTAVASLSSDTAVSIVIATYDRPNDLRCCLESIHGQATERKVEVVVVDNNPNSQLTPPVVAGFPHVVYVTEQRQGLSYARNAGIKASRGDIIICTDDDVTVPPDWLEKLIAPFARSDVMVVTGNVLPREMETRAQQFFELYGGLGRGFNRMEIGQEWFNWFRFEAVPTWLLGATANAAFRATIFSDPEIGLMDEALGAGTPTGCSEDTYVFYRVLKSGYTLIYEPTAFVWHTHRNTYQALRRQLFNYSKGHVAYHIITFQRDGDWRALFHLFLWVPLHHLRRILMRLRGQTDYPLRLNFVEIAGHLVGPWALWRSRRNVRRNARRYSSDRQAVVRPSFSALKLPGQLE